VTGRDPALLIFDSKLTTQAVVAEFDDRGIGFITLRARQLGVTRTLAALPQAPGSPWPAPGPAARLTASTSTKPPPHSCRR
jgi:hypothetical protein